jgi:hypothetical protein
MDCQEAHFRYSGANHFEVFPSYGVFIRFLYIREVFFKLVRTFYRLNTELSKKYEIPDQVATSLTPKAVKSLPLIQGLAKLMC